MEKDIDKIPKNQETDIIIRIDDFGGKRGVTIREFVKSERYTGFTKAGTRIPADKFSIFKAAINSIDESDLVQEEGEQATLNDSPKKPERKEASAQKSAKPKSKKESIEEEYM